MNVIRMENANASKNRGRGRGRGSEHIVNILPKYQFDTGLQKRLVKSFPTRSSVAKTPARLLTNNNRNRGTSSSSIIGTSVRKSSTGSNNPGTRTPGSTSSAATSTMIVAVTSGRGEARSEVGMAAIDLRYPYVVLCQISDCQTYVNTLTKIYVFNPVEILMPDTMCNRGNDKNKLYSSIREKFDGLTITPVSRIHFKETEGLERIRTHAATEYSSVELFVKQKYYALSAVAALIKYVEFIQHIVYAPKSMKIEFQGSPNTTMIDIESAQNLELVASLSGQSGASLLGAMDRCLTPMGRRLLRSCILQPPCEENRIIERQCCVAELVSNQSLSSAIQPIVRRLFGADRLLNLPIQTLQSDTMQSAAHNLNYVLLLKNCLDIVPELRAALTSGEASFFEKVRTNLENPQFNLMKDEILRIIHPDARSVIGYTSSNMQRCFAINVGINDLLDIARQTFCELIDDMKSMVEQLAQKHKLPLSLECNTTLGYHIELDMHRRSYLKIGEIPADFIEVRKNRNSLSMTTNALMVLNQQCKVACEELHVMSNVLLCDLLINIRQHVGCLFQLSTDVAELDLILSLAQISSASEYVRPTFGPRLKLRNSMHPIMEAFGMERIVPNDVEASISHNFHTIIGPNMSGKSVYLKQIVLLHIMAQIGCYVPATEAEFRIVDRIFCRICHRDDIECNASMFMLEMKEAEYILRSVTPKSLVILDELCRATTVEEGSSIAWAICEQLLMTKAFTFSATHFLHLTKLVDLYHNVTNHCFETVTRLLEGSRDPRLIYTHKLVKGIGLIDDYGVRLAELCGVPESITSKARDYTLKGATNAKSNNTCLSERVTWEKTCYDRVAKMYTLLENNEFIRENIMELIGNLDIDSDKNTYTTKTRPLKHVQTTEKATQVADLNEDKQLNAEESTSFVHLPNMIKRTASNEEPSTSFKVPKYPKFEDVAVSTLTEDARIMTITNPNEEEYVQQRSAGSIQENIDGAKSPDHLSDKSGNSRQTSSTLSVSKSSTSTAILFSKIEEVKRRLKKREHMSQQLFTPKRTDSSNVHRQRHSSFSGSMVVEPMHNLNNTLARNRLPAVNLDRSNALLSNLRGSQRTSAFSTLYFSAMSSTSSRSCLDELCSCSNPHELTFSQMSSLTDAEKMNARRIEAEIFKKIEGDAFDEREFYGSLQLPVFIDLTDDKDKV